MNVVEGSLISERLANLPASPGVYLMKDTGGEIIYVGKASSLRNRVRSYFHEGQESLKTRQLVARIADIEFFVTGSEQEALILEMNLIKRHRPRFNVRMKDDKSFPYLKIEIGTEWPRVYMTRRLVQDGSRYFGPFASVWSLKETIKILRRLFPFRFCTKPITGVDSRACLEYHMGRCLAPCTGAVSREEYARVIKQVILFLEGRQEKIVRELENQMKRAAKAEEFEKAARLRDQIQAVRNVIEAQRIATTVKGDQDVIAFAQDGDLAYAQISFIHGSKLIGRESFTLQGTQNEEPGQIMSSFIKQFYGASPQVPPRLLLQYEPEDLPVIHVWLEGKRGGKVEILVPRRGSRKHLVDVVAENARQGLEHMRIKHLAATGVADAALAELQKVLGLPNPPARLEAYDISNIQGRLAVGSMVVSQDGRPRPSHYRRFRIKTVAGADDYAMLHEVLGRRFRRLKEEDSSTWAILPDLVLIDGGRGQINAAVAAMREAGAGSVKTISLAKENEEIFVPDRPEPIVLPRSNPGLQLLQRLRDEAHRFAISYYSRTHRKEAFVSALDTVPGIGPKRRRALLKRFGNVQAIREAPVEALAAADGMSRKLAEKMKEYL